jgi:hypothetical protein
LDANLKAVATTAPSTDIIASVLIDAKGRRLPLKEFHDHEDPLWPSRHEIDVDSLRESGTYDDFMNDAVELFKELAILCSLGAGVRREADATTDDRNEAIRRGLIVRITKLAKSQLNETCAGHGDQQLALARQLLETCGNLLYVLHQGEGAYEAFVVDSLIAERELQELIRRNIDERGGKVLPIEERMLRSIEKTAVGAGVDLSKLPPRGKSGWPSAFDRLRSLGLQDLYVLFRLGSVAIHGGWSDLYLHHLDDEGDGRFSIHLDDLRPRPEPLTSMAIVVCTTLTEYLRTQANAIRELFEPRLDDILERIKGFEGAHEAYLQRQTKNDVS